MPRRLDRTFLFLCPLTLAGCSATVHPPADAAATTEVYVVNHGRTSSLVIPASDGGMLRYAYGDWEFYALRNDGLARGVAALLLPTQGALGRGVIDAPPSVENLRGHVSSVVDVAALPVDRRRLAAFEHRMEDEYARYRDTEIENRPYGLSFVKYPRRYTYFYNSNHVVAEWLRELGCRTEGLAFGSSWRVGGAD